MKKKKQYIWVIVEYYQSEFEQIISSFVDKLGAEEMVRKLTIESDYDYDSHYCYEIEKLRLTPSRKKIETTNIKEVPGE